METRPSVSWSDEELINWARNWRLPIVHVELGFAVTETQPDTATVDFTPRRITVRRWNGMAKMKEKER